MDMLSQEAAGYLIPRRDSRGSIERIQVSCGVKIELSVQSNFSSLSVLALEEKSGRPAGRVRLRLLENDVWFLHDLRVEPESRSQGIGSALIGKAVRAAGMLGGIQISLEALPAPDGPSVSKLVGLYSRHGFTVIGESSRGGICMQLGRQAWDSASFRNDWSYPLPENYKCFKVC